MSTATAATVFLERPKASTTAIPGFVPSNYQQAIFDHLAASGGNGLVTARAGSGKTTTLVQCAKRLPTELAQNTTFIAFNKHIADELRRRMPRGIEVFTSHSLALRAVRPVIEPYSNDAWIDSSKYRKLIKAYWINQGINLKMEPDVLDTTSDLLRFAMLTLTDVRSPVAMANLAKHYGIIPTSQELVNHVDAVQKVLHWGYHGTPDRSFDGIRERISFDDMLYYANVLEVKLPTYRMVMVDESQDISAAQRQLIIRATAREGRSLWVGDERQAIYSFIGADAESFAKIRQATQALDLSLPICYRCPVSHLELIKSIVPDIQACDGAPVGVVEWIDRKNLFGVAGLKSPVAGGVIRAGDMVLCRTNAPLVKLTFELISRGIAARMRGRDIGAQLAKIIDAVTAHPTYCFEHFLQLLQGYTARIVRALAQRENSDMQIESLLDKSASIETIYQRAVAAGVSSADGLKAFIDTLFCDDRAVVTLSAVHKAKGLENPRIFILRPDQLPFHRAKLPWERTAEENLKYVAFTRSTAELYFIEEEE